MTIRRRNTLLALLRVTSLAALACSFASPSARAVTVELKDAAPDRVERQRAAAEGRLPLPDTPDTQRFTERLAAKGIALGADVLIRIFKAESELEVWIEKDASYVLFDTYPICHWSGGLGPKLRQGDKQSPEGFYSLTSRNLHRAGRWPNALNLGYPNAFDRSQSRSGAYILVHGGCSSVGCFAMTDPVMTEIYALVTAALRAQQRHIPVHVFPFRMTDENFERYKANEWIGFWRNLKDGYDAFERTKRPPRVSVCHNRYAFEDRAPLDSNAAGPIAACSETAAVVQTLDQLNSLMPPHEQSDLWLAIAASTSAATGAAASSLRTLASIERRVRMAGQDFNTPQRRLASGRSVACNPSLPACRRHMALNDKRFVKRTWAANQNGRPRASGPKPSRQGRT